MKQILQNKGWAFAIVFLVVANLATVTFFWVERFREAKPKQEIFRNPRHPQPPKLLLEELKFSTNQQKQYDDLFEKHISQVGVLKDSIRKAKEAFFTLLGNSQIPVDILQKKANEAAALQGRLDMLTFEHFKQVKSICTPDQQKKFDEIIQTVIERMAPPPPPPPPGRGSGRDENRPPPPPQFEDGSEGNRPPPPPLGEGADMPPPPPPAN